MSFRLAPTSMTLDYLELL